MKTKLLSRCSRGMTPTHEGMEIYKQAERLDTLFYELEIILWQSTAFPAI